MYVYLWVPLAPTFKHLLPGDCVWIPLGLLVTVVCWWLYGRLLVRTELWCHTRAKTDIDVSNRRRRVKQTGVKAMFFWHMFNCFYRIETTAPLILCDSLSCVFGPTIRVRVVTCAHIARSVYHRLSSHYNKVPQLRAVDSKISLL